MKEITITPNQIKNAIEDLVNENERLQHNQEVSTKWEIKLTQKNTKLIEENKRLKSIINELERYINEEYIYDELGMKIFDASKLQDKLQELKGSDKE